MLVGDRARPVFLTSWEMLYRSSPAFSCLVLFVRVGRVPDVVVRLFAQSPPLILPAVLTSRAHNIHTDARVALDSDGTSDRLEAGLGSGLETRRFIVRDGLERGRVVAITHNELVVRVIPAEPGRLLLRSGFLKLLPDVLLPISRSKADTNSCPDVQKRKLRLGLGMGPNRRRAVARESDSEG